MGSAVTTLDIVGLFSVRTNQNKRFQTTMKDLNEVMLPEKKFAHLIETRGDIEFFVSR